MRFKLGVALAVFGLVVLLNGSGACIALALVGHDTAAMWTWAGCALAGLFALGIGVQLAEGEVSKP